MSSDNQESTTIIEDDASQLKAHKQVWGQKELLFFDAIPLIAKPFTTRSVALIH